MAERASRLLAVSLFGLALYNLPGMNTHGPFGLLNVFLFGMVTLALVVMLLLTWLTDN